MKAVMMLIVLTAAVNVFAVENRDVECSVTRYTTQIRADGSKYNEVTLGEKNKVMKWSEASDSRSQSVSYEVDGMAMSASMSSDKCWDDDRMVECNRRSLLLHVYNRADGSSTSVGYDLNAQAAGTQMNLVIQSPKGYHSVSCRQP